VAAVKHDVAGRLGVPADNVLIAAMNEVGERYEAGDLFVPEMLIAARAMSNAVLGLRYSNFKDSVTEHDRHDAYADVWGDMMRFQTHRQDAAAPGSGQRHNRRRG